ncbi:hypothetical protein [Glutamicibacter sp. Je.9.36]|uniref:hypothetical protein n=1 Tax=Glutamicibacter sp. Je.9.36 TaxID=3142837 RepID=UPI003DA8E00A
MQTCDICGNASETVFTLSRNGRSGRFDSFECAIHAMAERCAHCGCAILGHAVHHGPEAYCCQHCAEHAEP